MGGKLLAKEFNLPEKRIPKAEFLRISSEILQKLNLAEPNRRAKIIPYCSSKLDFGDLDLLCESFSGDKINWSDFLTKEFGCKPHKNGNVYTIAYNDFQVDFILASSEIYNTALDYFSFEQGNINGVLARKLGFRYKHSGLFLNVPLNYFSPELPAHEYSEILVSRITRNIFDILGVDYEWFKAGFNNPTDIYDWVSTGKYFNPEMFAFEELNHVNRTRNRKRKFYTEFVEWCKGKSSSKTIPSKSEMFEKILAEYPSVSPRLEEVRTSVILNKERRAKFNGLIIKELFNVEGKELGQFIINFNKKFKDKEEMNVWLDSKSIEEVRDKIIKFNSEICVGCTLDN